MLMRADKKRARGREGERGGERERERGSSHLFWSNFDFARARVSVARWSELRVPVLMTFYRRYWKRALSRGRLTRNTFSFSLTHLLTHTHTNTCPPPCQAIVFLLHFVARFPRSKHHASLSGASLHVVFFIYLGMCIHSCVCVRARVRESVFMPDACLFVCWCSISLGVITTQWDPGSGGGPQCFLSLLLSPHTMDDALFTNTHMQGTGGHTSCTNWHTRSWLCVCVGVCIMYLLF